MTTMPLVLESRELANSLYVLLQTLDPARWRQELEPIVMERFHTIHRRCAELSSGPQHASEASVAVLRAHLVSLKRILDEALDKLIAPRQTEAPAEVKTALPPAWAELRHQLIPLYETMGAALKKERIRVPAVRPTNYARNAVHVGFGLVTVAFIQHLVAPEMLIWASGAFAAAGWFIEIARKYSAAFNRGTMWVAGAIAHPHERHRISSSAWYASAIFLMAILHSVGWVSLAGGVVAAVVLGFGDPMAAVIGRRFGRIKIGRRRSLEGSLAFVAAGTLAALAVLMVYYPQLSMGATLAVAAVGATAGAIAELLTGPVDDNLSIPVLSAIAASAVGFLVGV